MTAYAKSNSSALDPEPYTGGRNFGHLAYAVGNIYETCSAFIARGVTINRPPRDGRMAFIRAPDGIAIVSSSSMPYAPFEIKDSARPFAKRTGAPPRCDFDSLSGFKSNPVARSCQFDPHDAVEPGELRGA